MTILWLVYIVTLLWILRDAWVLNLNIWRSLSWSRKYVLESADEGTKPNLLLFIPVLREQVHLREVMEHMGSLPFSGRKQIVLITTEREIAENGGNQAGTTLEVAQELVAEFDQTHPGLYRLIHCPYVISNKSTQTNYALSVILQEGEWDARKTYVGCYDADSRPGKNTLISLQHLVTEEEKKNRGWPIAIQQPSLYLKNFFGVSWYLKLEALFQTRWVLGHEIRTQRRSTQMHSDWNPPYAYCVGHGMFIRLDFLHRTNGYPDPVDDVPMGFRLNFAGIPIHPLPTYDLSEVAPSVSELVAQSGRWSLPSFIIWQEHKKTKKILPVRSVRAGVLLVKGMIDSFTWVHVALHFISLLCLLLSGADTKLLLLTLAAVYLDSGLGILMMLGYLPGFSDDVPWSYSRLNPFLQMWLLIASPVRGMIRGLGPVLGIFVWFRLMRKGVNFPKTERAPLKQKGKAV
ncbi:glycosyltransferase [Paenactinomyces guangxiensis]|uniref:Glycosyltransferase n=1 Tax=Paenactinomyces guangxiensis TaxID=1490290 RepID=A0A7W2A644_9BACL|nr:glycosyltransferase [Paenactinomyces guangxiensis]MBA4492991.1 glycosyltransferase [Paenactinomyces guangxiensis]MBH8590160.1 glycosyltransferase [Paenactinomyces guangxiensis]